MVGMDELRKLMARLGFKDAQSLLQSGNLVFRGDAQPTTGLERLLEEEVKKRLSLQTLFFVRTSSEWKTIVARNPFPEEARHDPSHLAVMFFKTAPEPGSVKELQKTVTGPEVIRPGGRHCYVTYPDGFGRSHFTLPVIEKGVGSKGTGRNWNTVMKLAAATARLVVTVIALFFTGCEGRNEVINPGTLPFPLSVDFHPGQSVFIPETGLTVRFDSVIADSRCPLGALCIWEGDGATGFTIARNWDGAVACTLHTFQSPIVERYGVSFRLTQLSPFPRVGGKIDPAAYVATIAIGPGPIRY